MLALRTLFQTELDALPVEDRQRLDPRFSACKRASGRLPPPHDPHGTGLLHHARIFAEKAWPPRAFTLLRIWRSLPARAESFLRRHRPHARFMIVGHTHRPGVWRRRSGVVVVNTGSFCPPLGRCVVDLTPDHLSVRAVRSRRGIFYLGPVKARFELTPAKLEIEPSAGTFFPS